MFQSTHPRGVRHDFQTEKDRIEQVSIHAPTRGATYIYAGTNAGCMSFNPRTHAGCDLVLNCSVFVVNMFQSTHPRGVRLLPVITNNSHAMFQSTHPRGVRHA